MDFQTTHSLISSGISIIMVFVVLGIIAQVSIFISSQRRLNKIIRMTESLSEGVNDETVRDYIKMARRIKIPRSSRAWHNFKSAYEIVKSSRRVSPEIKEEMRNVLLSRGVTLRG